MVETCRVAARPSARYRLTRWLPPGVAAGLAAALVGVGPLPARAATLLPDIIFSFPVDSSLYVDPASNETRGTVSGFVTGVISGLKDGQDYNLGDATQLQGISVSNISAPVSPRQLLAGNTALPSSWSELTQWEFGGAGTLTTRGGTIVGYDSYVTIVTGRQLTDGIFSIFMYSQPGIGWPFPSAYRNSIQVEFEDQNGGTPVGVLAGINQQTVTFTPVPGPLPLLGAGVAFAYTRRLRRRLKAVSTPSAPATPTP